MLQIEHKMRLYRAAVDAPAATHACCAVTPTGKTRKPVNSVWSITTRSNHQGCARGDGFHTAFTH